MAYVTNTEATPVFTIPRASTDETSATVPPPKLDFPEKSRASAAAYRAVRLFPGPVGEVLHREIEFYVMCGLRTDQTCLLPRLIDHLMTAVEDHR